MEVAFYFASSSPDSLHVKLAEIMVRSCREHHDCKITQCTDKYSLPIEGVDDVRRSTTDEHPYVAKAFSFADFDEKDVLYVDYDVVFLEDVSDVWEQDFDVAMKPTHPELVVDAWDDPAVNHMPYNHGTMFARTNDIWKDIIRNGDIWHSEGLLNLYWEQIAVKGLDYNFLDLSSDYNYSPQYILEDVSGRKILHFKGEQRKAWMYRYYLTNPKTMAVLKKIPVPEDANVNEYLERIREEAVCR